MPTFYPTAKESQNKTKSTNEEMLPKVSKGKNLEEAKESLKIAKLSKRKRKKGT